MKIRPCKNLQNINVDCPSCRCADWFCFYDEKYNKVIQSNPSLSFEDRCEIVRRTAVTCDMSYVERLKLQKFRYGL